MSARVTFFALFFVCATSGAASAACGNAISDFEKIINSDAATGNLNKAVYRRIVAELARAQSSCIAGREVEASSALAAIKRRHGYR